MLGTRGELVAVRDVEHAQPALAPGLEDHVHDLLGGRAVELARDLVGEQQVGLVRERDRDRDALRLAARERVRAVAGGAVPRPSSVSSSRARARAARSAGDARARARRSRTAVRNGIEIVALEHDADPVRAQARAGGVVERREVATVEVDAARVGQQQSGQQRDQRGLAAARASDEARRRAARELEADVVQDLASRSRPRGRPSRRRRPGRAPASARAATSALRASASRPARRRTQPASWCGRACRA